METLDKLLESNLDLVQGWFIHPGFDALLETIQERMNNCYIRIQHNKLRSDEDIREELAMKGEVEGLQRLMDWLQKKKQGLI